jgi:hypothetical protein
LLFDPFRPWVFARLTVGIGIKRHI